MRGNSFGNFLVLTTFGESHGPALGAVLDGMPAGVHLSTEHIAAELRRRRPGQSAVTSGRLEEDVPEILSGVFEDVTLGTPIAVIVRNTDARSEDYDAHVYRVGHAESVWEQKYGLRDYRGGGRTSGRETLARVIAGAIAGRLLPPDLSIVAFVSQIGNIAARVSDETLNRIHVDSFATRCPDTDADKSITQELLRCKESGDSLGGIIELRIDGVRAGLGEPVFNKAKSALTAAMMSIGAVSGVSLGDAFSESSLPGNIFHLQQDGAHPGTDVRAHGIQGGLTNGQRITLRVAIKPTSTIGQQARQGRHDPCIAPRIVPVVEAMSALVLADLLLAQRLDRL